MAPVTGDEILLSAKGLTKTFGDFTAVDGIDFAVRKGEAFGFLGPNGAGKSSTMRMVGCVSPVSGGELRLFGQDPATDGPAIRARLGVVPEHPQSPGGDRGDAADHAHGGRLARAVGAEEAERLARADRDVDALDGLEVAERLAQSPCRDHGFCHRSRP